MEQLRWKRGEEISQRPNSCHDHTAAATRPQVVLQDISFGKYRTCPEYGSE
jgi:hypothetical protein